MELRRSVMTWETCACAAIDKMLQLLRFGC